MRQEMQEARLSPAQTLMVSSINIKLREFFII